MWLEVWLVYSLVSTSFVDLKIIHRKITRIDNVYIVLWCGILVVVVTPETWCFALLFSYIVHLSFNISAKQRKGGGNVRDSQPVSGCCLPVSVVLLFSLSFTAHYLVYQVCALELVHLNLNN